MAEETMVRAADLGDRGDAELMTLLGSKKEQLFRARFAHALGQLEKTHRLRALRRDIACLKTVLHGRQKAAQENGAANV